MWTYNALTQYHKVRPQADSAEARSNANSAGFKWAVKEGFVMGQHYLVEVSTDLSSWISLPPAHYSMTENTQNGMTDLDLEVTHDYGDQVFLRLVQP